MDNFAKFDYYLRYQGTVWDRQERYNICPPKDIKPSHFHITDIYILENKDNYISNKHNKYHIIFNAFIALKSSLQFK